MSGCLRRYKTGVGIYLRGLNCIAKAPGRDSFSAGESPRKLACFLAEEHQFLDSARRQTVNAMRRAGWADKSGDLHPGRLFPRSGTRTASRYSILAPQPVGSGVTYFALRRDCPLRGGVRWTLSSVRFVGAVSGGIFVHWCVASSSFRETLPSYGFE